jgi:Zn-dependent peptidase ImmA (M78 family)
MTTHEKLIEEAAQIGIDVILDHIPVRALKGLYCDRMIILDKDIGTNAEKACVLAEELGHYHFTAGDILCEANTSDVKQEKLARNWAYERMVPISSIIKAYELRIGNCEDFAEYLGVTEKFLEQAIRHYEVKYDNRFELDGYVIVFSPLGVMKRVYIEPRKDL